MLCRVADSLFWMSRYIERAENTVRLADVMLQTLLESEHAQDDISYSHWQPLLASLGEQEIFEDLYDSHDSHHVTEFLIFSRDNHSSVFSSIAAARENARMIRDQISSEMWEVINKLYLYLKNTDAKQVCHELNFNFFRQIKEYSLLFQGITESTFPHQLGYEFIECGRQIERADKTCRILDAKRYMKTTDDQKSDSLDYAQWAALLKGCSALDAYRQIFVADIEAANVRKFLILSRHFPRSVLFCIQKLQNALHSISQCPITHFSNEAERLVGRLISIIKYSTDKDLEGDGATKMITEIEDELAAIAIEINKRYMFSEIIDPALDTEEKKDDSVTSQSQTSS